LAEDLQMPSHRHCVIKELKPIHNNPQVYQLVQERFKREAAILEDLGQKHEQIPQLYAYCEEQGHFYLIQEYINGETLADKILKVGVLTEANVQEILLKLLTVLEYVHSYQIVHRDIKPNNIILRSSDNLPVLIDFGAVKEVMGTVITLSGNSNTSIVIGTPGFMSSEQSIGRPVYGSDLYALGLTMIHLLTGKKPPELSTDPLTGEIQWRHYAPDVSSSLATVLDKSIKSHHQERFLTAQAMKNELLSASSQNTVVVASSASTSIQSSRTNSHQDWLKISLASGLTGLILMIVFLSIQYQQRKEFAEQLFQLQPSPESPTPSSPENEKTPEPTPTFSPNPSPSPSESPPFSFPKEQEIPKPVPILPPTPSPLEVEPETPGEIYLNENQAISTIKNLYDLLSNRQYDQAIKLFSSQLASQFNPQFFNQFDRVTVEDLKITSRTDSMINFVGRNTYVYLDGSTQQELRSYTVSKIDGENKITASEFIKVTKFR
ncbi:MAG: serine/threonine-protein kinase, partial [Cyanobacteria bacterium P01_G01_bin.49]